jgi:multisubunit Na+/H+ antiporter MnhF subunit
MNSLNIQVVYIRRHIINIKYKKIKMINIIHMIYILNFIFTIVLYVTE